MTPELKDTELVLDNVDAHHLNRCEINPPNPQNEERAPTHIKAKSRLHYQLPTTTAPHQKPETPTLTSNDRRSPMRLSTDIATTDLAKRYSYYYYTHDASTTYDTRATNNEYHVDVTYEINETRPGSRQCSAAAAPGSSAAPTPPEHAPSPAPLSPFPPPPIPLPL